LAALSAPAIEKSEQGCQNKIRRETRTFFCSQGILYTSVEPSELAVEQGLVEAGVFGKELLQGRINQRGNLQERRMANEERDKVLKFGRGSDELVNRGFDRAGGVEGSNSAERFESVASQVDVVFE
jgi:hypothetical protein